MDDIRHAVDSGALCRECLDEIVWGPVGHRQICSSCKKQMAWEEKRDAEYESREESDGDQDSEYE